MKKQSRLAVLLAAILVCVITCTGVAFATATELNSSLSDVEAALSAEEVQAQLVYSQLMETTTLKDFFDTLMLEENNTGAYALNEEQLNGLYQHITMIYLSVDMEGEDASYYADLVDTLNYLAKDATYSVVTLAEGDSVVYSGQTWANSVVSVNDGSIVSRENGIIEFHPTDNDPYMVIPLSTAVTANSGNFKYAVVVYRADAVCNKESARVYLTGTRNAESIESYAYNAKSGTSFQTDLDGRTSTSGTLIGDQNIHCLLFDIQGYNGTVSTLRLDLGGGYGTSVGRIQIESLIFCKDLYGGEDSAQHIANARMTAWGKSDTITYYAQDSECRALMQSSHNCMVSYSSGYKAWKLQVKNTCTTPHNPGSKNGEGGIPCTSENSEGEISCPLTYDGLYGLTGWEIYQKYDRVCDPMAGFDAVDMPTDYKYVVITYLCPVSNRSDNKKQDGGSMKAEFFPLADGGGAVTGFEVTFPIEESVYYRTAVVDLTTAPGYADKTVLTGLRIDPFTENYAYEDDIMYIYSISFCTERNVIDFIEVPEDMFGNLSYELQVDYDGGTAGTHVVATTNGESKKGENSYYIEKNAGSNQSERKHTFSWNGEPVRSGYQFARWKFTSSNATISTGDNSITIALPSETQTDSALVAVMKAEWTELTAEITYMVVGPDGKVETPETVNKSGFVALGDATISTDNEVTETIGQDTGAPSATAIANAPNYKFVGWYTDAECKNEVEDSWVSGNKLTPKKSETTNLYQNATYYAKFDYDVADLTIIKKGLAAGDSAIIRVVGYSTSSDEQQTWYITLTGQNDTAVIKDMKINTKYTITEMDEWTVYYSTTDEDLGVEKIVKPFVNGVNSNNTVEITNSPKQDKWLHDESAKINDLSTPSAGN